MVEASGMKQLIDFLTHKQGNTWDLIITELAVEVQTKMSIVGLIYLTTCNIPKTKMVTKQIKYRDFNKVNMTEMIEDMNLDSINLVSENLEELMSEFRLCMTKPLEKHPPMKLSKTPFRDR